MEILDEKDGVDTELLVYGMTLINKVRDGPSLAVSIWWTVLWEALPPHAYRFGVYSPLLALSLCGLVVLD